jgi:hypothetical protein
VSTTATTTATAVDPADEIVGRLNFRGDIRHTDASIVGPTDDGRWFAPVYADYSPARDVTSIAYRTATAQDFSDEEFARALADIARRRAA